MRIVGRSRAVWDRGQASRWTKRIGLATAFTLAGLIAAVLPSASAAYASPVFVAAAACSTGGGWESTASGQVVAFGGAPQLGWVTVPLHDPIVAMASIPDGHGYWLVASDGGVFTFGDASYYGSTGAIHLNKPIVATASSPDGHGYWLVASDGGVFTFGDASYYGSTGAIHLNKPIVATASSPDGHGYWLVASDGGVFTFGDASYYGSTGAIHLNKPIVATASSPDGHGYWLVASDGGVFTFGDASYRGTLGGTGATVVAAVPLGGAYTLVESNGTTHSYGSAVIAGAGLGRSHTTKTTIAPSPTSTTTSTTQPAVSAPTTTVPAGTEPVLGVMQADPQWMAADHAAGAREAMLNVDWSQWEPQGGVFNGAYAAQQASIANQYRANGWTVAVDVGLQSPPSWVMSLADGQLVDQNGVGSGTPDYEYSQTVRSAASAYISQVVATMGAVSSYRIGLGVNGEMMYPDTNSNQWWGFASDAQRGGNDLPLTVGVSPMPGWTPGASTWNGLPVTSVQVAAWYNWYFGALADGLAWEIGTFRAAGFGETLQLLMPGDGATPALYNQRLAADLAPTSGDGYSTMNTGAVWWKMLDALAARASLTGTAVDVTSVYDGSGSPRGNVCQASDTSVSLASADPWSSGWSDTRWLTYLAEQHGLPVMGENPGNTSPADLTGIMNLAKSCGLTALQWAWDYQLHSASSSLASTSEVGAAWTAAGL